MVGQSKLSICLRALVPEPSNGILHMSDLTPSQCFRAIALSLAIDPNKIPSLFSVVEYEGHHHPLYFMDKSSSELHECNAYDSYCSRLKVSDEFSQTKPFIFRCQQCHFNVHLLCGPLPPIIKSKLHFHPLTLVDSLWEDNSGDYYCDVCEEGRNPQICVYACEECKYVAHIHCMIYEISRVLNGEYGDVNLSIAKEQVLSTFQHDPALEIQECKLGETLLTLNRMILNLKGEEQRLVAQHFEIDTNKSSEIAKLPHKSPDSFYSDVFGYDDDEESLDADGEDFRRLVTRVKWFFERERLQLSSKNLDVKMVKLVDCMVPWTLAPILETLLRKRLVEHIKPSPSDYQKLTPEMKSLSFTFLCHLINSMRRTRVGDVNEELLREWYCQAMFLKRLGFRLSFVFERLKRVALAHFGLRVSRFESETPKTLTLEIEKGKQEIITLEEKISKLKRRIADQEAELERYKSSPKSTFTKKCLKEASDLEWKTAGEDLFK